MSVGSKPVLQHHEHSRVVFLYHVLCKMGRECQSCSIEMTMKTMIRSFIAIPLPVEIQSKLEEFTRTTNITPRNGFRPVKSCNIHLTLKFLGDATPEQIQSVSSCLAEITQSQNPFCITFEGVGAFPNWNQPRVIWIGMHAPSELERLFNTIDQSTVKLGFPSEGRKFSPHLTLARVISSMTDPFFSRVILTLKSLKPQPKIGEMTASHIHLYKSDLQPGGPVYSVLSSHPFQRIEVVC